VDDSEGTVVARRQVGSAALVVVRGDLTAQRVDVVVNAANERLAHGGGVAAALARAGGPEVQAESDAWVARHGPVGSGRAAVTTAGRMPADRIVHVVGPRWRRDRDNEPRLRAAVTAALDAAGAAGATTVALPAISAGIFGYPPAEAARAIAGEAARWLAGAPRSVREVRLVGYDAALSGLFADAVEAAGA
jgi:putative ATPase